MRYCIGYETVCGDVGPLRFKTLYVDINKARADVTLDDMLTAMDQVETQYCIVSYDPVEDDDLFIGIEWV